MTTTTPRHRIRTASVIVLGLIIASAPASVIAGSGYEIDWQTIDGGGGTTTGGGYVLDATFGQPDPGAHTGGGYALTGGYWSGSVDASCPGDIDGSGAIGFTDLLAVLAAWGTCPPSCPQDVDGDQEVGFTDLLIVLAGWGPCP